MQQIMDVFGTVHSGQNKVRKANLLLETKFIIFKYLKCQNF